MANKQALRDLQSRLADRMQAARTQAPGVSWLAVECSGRGFLFPLREAGEIFPTVAITAVPHAQPWFLGVVNLRGGLYAVVDLADFLGVKVHDANPERSQLVAFSPSLETNCALLVDRLAGLRSVGQLVPEHSTTQHRPPFAGGLFRDEGGRAWQELNLSEMAHDDTFLRIVA